MTEKHYGYNDSEAGSTILWESSDGEPFTHIAEILDWEAFTRWLYHKRVEWDAASHEMETK